MDINLKIYLKKSGNSYAFHIPKFIIDQGFLKENKRYSLDIREVE